MNTLLRKWIACYIVAAICISLCPVMPAIAEQIWRGAGTIDDPYLISGGDDLAVLAENVNAGIHYRGKYFVMICDIDLAGFVASGETADQDRGWKPIGNHLKSFQGYFDGGNHAISNLYINRPNDNYIGLFGDVYNEIKNLRIASGNITGLDYVGAIAGNSTSLINCHNQANVSGHNNIGGLSGSTIYGYSIIKCRNDGNITGRASVGGIVGYTAGRLSHCYNSGKISGTVSVAGIAGTCQKFSYNITNCGNSGNITGVTTVAGIVGFLEGTLEVINCYNAGNITGAGDIKLIPDFEQVTAPLNVLVAGIAASGMGNNKIFGCYNRGAISDARDFSDIEPSVQNRVYGIGYAYAQNCYNIGDLYCANGDTVEICSESDHCYYNSETHTGTVSVKDIGKTTAEMQSPAFIDELFGSNWIMDTTPFINHGYPILRWQTSDMGTCDNPYVISSAGDLATLAENVNIGITYEGMYVIMDRDIDLAGFVASGETADQDLGWKPIGDGSNPFRGHFDGGNHAISNLYINRPNDDYIGLFGRITGEIKNLHIASGNITGLDYVGAIAGASGNITNCSNQANVSGSDDVGGLAGLIIDSTYAIIECRNSGDITGNRSVGGITGYKGGRITDCHNSGNISGLGQIAGIAGTCLMVSDSIINCGNSGNITGVTQVAGIVGYLDETTRVINCYNAGNITGAGDIRLLPYFEDHIKYYGTIGTFIAGIAASGMGNNKIFGCYNRGTISDTRDFSDIESQTPVQTYVYGIGGSGVSVQDCYNIGELYCPYGSAVEICRTSENSYYNTETHMGTVSAWDIARTTAEMQAPAFIDELADPIFIPDHMPPINNGYPILRWQISNRVTPSVLTPPVASRIVISSKLADAALSGGEADVPGMFVWADGAEKINTAGTFKRSVIFTPNDQYYLPLMFDIDVNIYRMSSGKSDGYVPSPTKATDKDLPSVSLKPNANTIRYMTGRGNKFEPDNVITRYEMFAALDHILEIKNPETPLTFSDTTPEYKELIDRFSGAGILEGFTDGTIKGEQGLTRAEFTKMMAIALNVQIKKHNDQFSDIPNHWARDYINSFAEFAYLLGYPDGTFQPDNPLTRAEFVAVVNRIIGANSGINAAGSFDDLLPAHWAYDDIMKVVNIE